MTADFQTRAMLAGQALPVVLLTSGVGKLPEDVASICVCIADAMMKKLSKPDISSSIAETTFEIEQLMATLLARGADKAVVVDDFPHRCGLDLPMNEGSDSDEMEPVAELSHEDSGYGPLLWRLAIAVLKSRRAAMESGQ